MAEVVRKGDKKFERIGILPNVKKSGAQERVRSLCEWLRKKELPYLFLEEDAEELGLRDERASRSDFAGQIDIAVILGGDGTMLRAAEVLDEKPIPIFGVNIGKLGFLTAVEEHEMFSGLEAVLNGKYKVTERNTLGCVMEAGESSSKHRALNEFVVGKLARERMVHLKTYINGEFFVRFSGDGIILATATGSMAYSLSAGGPIVTPELKCFLLTAVCPHMLFDRPLVLSPSDRLSVHVEEESGALEVSVDGRENILIQPPTEIEFFLHDSAVRVIQLLDSSFYETLRRKFFYPPSDP